MSKWQNVYNNSDYIDSNNNVTIDYCEEFIDSDLVPDKYSILTYNIFGLSINDSLKRLLDIRKDKLEQTISESNADFICLQEMSEYSYYTLKDTIDKYKYVSERPYIKQINRKRNADVYFMSKYKPSKITIYSLFGILGYNNSMLIVEYNNLIIINVYLQSGSKKSPGQLESNLVKRFSECRIKQLNVIYDIIKTYDKQNKNIVLCGDFNFHLDGNLDEWPENEIINKFKNDGFIDTYRDINPLLNGFTEDTDTNMLRYNMKLIDKQYRFDGIFYLLGLKLQDSDLKLYKNKISSNLIGQTTFYLDVNYSKWFINNISDASDCCFDSLKNVKKINNDYLIPINPSDHYGVLTVFNSTF